MSRISLLIVTGERKAFSNCLANFVNTPGAGAQPKGRPTH